VFAIGTAINAAAIVVGGLLGLLIKRDLSAARQSQLRKYVGLGVIVSGFHMMWTGLRPMSFGGAFGLLGIAVLSTTIGQLLGRGMRLQAGMNRLGRYAGETFTRAQKPESRVSFNDGFLSCTVLFCVGPLSVLGPLQEGVNGNFLVLVIKAAMDGLAAFAFARVFGASVLAAGLPVLALQGTITLLVAWLVLRSPAAELSHAANVTGGLLVVCAVLLVFEVRKVQLGDYLPALIVAPLLAWWFF
jgi:uncharacterized membrane protein YqgA involved in biofilm formation